MTEEDIIEQGRERFVVGGAYELKAKDRTMYIAGFESAIVITDRYGFSNGDSYVEFVFVNRLEHGRRTLKVKKHERTSEWETKEVDGTMINVPKLKVVSESLDGAGWTSESGDWLEPDGEFDGTIDEFLDWIAENRRVA